MGDTTPRRLEITIGEALEPGTTEEQHQMIDPMLPCCDPKSVAGSLVRRHSSTLDVSALQALQMQHCDPAYRAFEVVPTRPMQALWRNPERNNSGRVHTLDQGVPSDARAPCAGKWPA